MKKKLKKLIVMLLAFGLMFISRANAAELSLSITDAVIEQLKDSKYMVGTDQGFLADKKLTKAELTQVFYNMSDKKKYDVEKTINNFLDVDKDAWYMQSLCYAYENGIIVGNDKHEFEPSKNVSLIEVIIMFMRARGDKTAYSYPNGYIETAISKGIINQNIVDKLSINGEVNRALIGNMVYNLMFETKEVKKDVVFEGKIDSGYVVYTVSDAEYSKKTSQLKGTLNGKSVTYTIDSTVLVNILGVHGGKISFADLGSTVRKTEVKVGVRNNKVETVTFLISADITRRAYRHYAFVKGVGTTSDENYETLYDLILDDGTEDSFYSDDSTFVPGDVLLTFIVNDVLTSTEKISTPTVLYREVASITDNILKACKYTVQPEEYEFYDLAEKFVFIEKDGLEFVVGEESDIEESFTLNPTKTMMVVLPSDDKEDEIVFIFYDIADGTQVVNN